MGLAPMKSTVPCAFCLSLLAAFVGTGVVRLALATGDSRPGSVGAVDDSVLLGRSLRRLKATGRAASKYSLPPFAENLLRWLLQLALCAYLGYEIGLLMLCNAGTSDEGAAAHATTETTFKKLDEESKYTTGDKIK